MRDAVLKSAIHGLSGRRLRACVVGFALVLMVLAGGVGSAGATGISFNSNSLIKKFTHCYGPTCSAANSAARQSVQDARDAINHMINDAIADHNNNVGTQMKIAHDQWDTAEVFGTCIKIKMKFYDVIRLINSASSASIFSFIRDNIVIPLAAAIVNYACQYIVSTVNNILQSICLPLPNFGFSLAFSRPRTKTCDGLSLGNNLFSLQSGGMSSSLKMIRKLAPQDVKGGFE